MASPSTRSFLCIAAILCVILGAAFASYHRTATQKQYQYVTRIEQVSNLWQAVSRKLEEQRVVNRSLERDVAALVKERDSSSDLRTANQGGTTSVFANPTDPQMPDPRIQQLATERDELSEKLNDLSKAMSELQTQMAETHRRLEASEGDRDFLLQEMKRLRVEKSKLQQQFNDVAMLREQMHKLRDERAVSRRIDWMRRGLYGKARGGELLRKGFVATQAAPANFNLDVEVRQIGGAKVLPPAN